MTLVILTILTIIYGAWLGRMNGGGAVIVPRWASRVLIMAFFVLACIPYVGFWAILAALGVFGVSTGHGQYFPDRQLVGQRGRVEWIDFILDWIFGSDWRAKYEQNHKFTQTEKNQYFPEVYEKLAYRNAAGMFLTGFLVGLPAMLLLLSFGHSAGWLFALTGFLKMGAYLLYYKLKPNDAHTEYAEYLNGALRNLICVLVFGLYFVG